MAALPGIVQPSLAEIAAEYESLQTPVEAFDTAWAGVHQQLDTLAAHVLDLTRAVFQTPAAQEHQSTGPALAAAVTDDGRHLRDALAALRARFEERLYNLEHFLVRAILFQTSGGRDPSTTESVVPLPSGVSASSLTSDATTTMATFSPL